MVAGLIVSPPFLCCWREYLKTTGLARLLRLETLGIKLSGSLLDTSDGLHCFVFMPRRGRSERIRDVVGVEPGCDDF